MHTYAGSQGNLGLDPIRSTHSPSVSWGLFGDGLANVRRWSFEYAQTILLPSPPNTSPSKYAAQLFSERGVPQAYQPTYQ